MNTTPDTPSTDSVQPPAPRSTSGVIAIVAAIVLAPIVLAVLFVVGSGSSGAGAAVADNVRTNRIQAVYMSNDRVFFGSVDKLDGDWIELQDAYFLRRGEAGNVKSDEAGSTEIVPIQQEVGGDGDMLLNAREIVLVQDLAADSAIASKIEDSRG